MMGFRGALRSDIQIGITSQMHLVYDDYQSLAAKPLMFRRGRLPRPLVLKSNSTSEMNQTKARKGGISGHSLSQLNEIIFLTFLTQDLWFAKLRASGAEMGAWAELQIR